MSRLTFLLILVATLKCFPQTLHDEVVKIYDFSPSKLSKDEQNKKIPLMDEFWNKVKTDSAKYLAQLRSELQIEGNPKFFYYDGGQLLLSISTSITDKELVLEALSKTDLNDVEERSYVGTLNYLAHSGLNTTVAALRILDDKEFKFYLPEHAFYFNQGYCLTYSLLPTKPEYYLSEVIGKFKTVKDVGTRKSIVTFLWFSNSCSGNEFLQSLVNDKSMEMELTDYASDLLKRKFKQEKYYKELGEMSYDDLVKAQSASTNRMSDEAIYELDYITKLLRKNKCR